MKKQSYRIATTATSRGAFRMIIEIREIESYSAQGARAEAHYDAAKDWPQYDIEVGQAVCTDCE